MEIELANRLDILACLGSEPLAGLFKVDILLSKSKSPTVNLRTSHILKAVSFISWNRAEYLLLRELLIDLSHFQ